MAVAVRLGRIREFILLILFVSRPGEGKRTTEKIYIDLVTQNNCFRTLNATHQFGCSSAFSGNVGILHYIEGLSDLNLVLQSGSHAPYVVLLEAKDFNISIMESITSSKRVNGVLVNSVLSNDTLLETLIPEFSPDLTCPNDQYGFYHNKSDYRDCKKLRWNAAGSGMYFRDYSIPIFAISTQEDLDKLLYQCYYPFNQPVNGTLQRSYPLCAAELVNRMLAVKDTVTCTRRSNLILNLDPTDVCDPLVDKNILGTVKVIPAGTSREKRSIIVAATRMDSLAMFSNEYQSADTSVSGIITLLAAAEVIGKVKHNIISRNDTKDIMFTFFHGEAFDYIGSSRMVYDMEQDLIPTDNSSDGQQPIRLENIDRFIELAQVALRDKDKLWIHSDPVSQQDPNVEKEVNLTADQLMKYGSLSSVQFDLADHSLPLPPASVQRFLRKQTIPAVVITDHEREYKNKYYNSRYDLPNNIQASYPSSLNESEKYDYSTDQAVNLTKVSTALARSLYFLATNKSLDDNVTANLSTVNHLIYCFLHNPHCELFNYVIDNDNAKSLAAAMKPFPFYVGVAGSPSQVGILTERILALFLGDINKTNSDCKADGNDKKFTFTWMQGALLANNSGQEREGLCVKSSVYTTLAKSPAFDIDGYDLLSGEYSTFTESVWSPLSVRIFLVPSQQSQTVALSVGVIILLSSFLLLYFINAKADIIFAHGSANYY